MKHIKLFESFINEELSPELKKRTYDEMMKIANDPNAIDRLKRRNQAENVLNSVTPAVEKLRNELEDHAKRVMVAKDKDYNETIVVEFKDYGYDKSKAIQLYVGSKSNTGYHSLIIVNIFKDKYENVKLNTADAYEFINTLFLSDRAFINTLKKLIVQIQKDEIPGDEQVPEQPESITPKGGL